MLVSVPFGKQTVEGFVIGIQETTEVPKDKIKPITSVLSNKALIKPEFLNILDEVCDKFKLRKIDVLQLFAPSYLRGRKKPRTPKNAVIRARDIATEIVILTSQQQSVVNTILEKDNAKSVFVLHGVTGSGKTEVYMTAIEQILQKEKTAIMLVPEIALTPQMLANFRARFGNLVAILHSGLTTAERHDEWMRLYNGDAKIALGARSAIFAPLENVGVIIVDEEHDSSYTSDSNPRFHCHEIAKIRGSYNNCPIVLGSATPSIESYHNAKIGKYKLLKLDRRVNNLQMPTIEVVDMCAELRSGNGGIFSHAFLNRLTQVIEDGKQAIIFLNRRGFSSSLMCKSCGWTAKCDNCDVSLVYHRDDGQLKCHYCSARFKYTTTCPECKGNYLKYGSTGTQKVVEELQNLFKDNDVPIFRMDADNTKTKNAHADILDQFAKTPRSILVGTQMIAKGHHFPDVALVGIIDADNSLRFSDFRATERTFQLITQVSGRAGRKDSTGHVVLQTYLPRHYVYQLAANYDYKKFFDKELNTRQVTKYPPFTTVIRILFSGSTEQHLLNAIKDIMGELRTRQSDFVYLGSMKSPISRLQNKFRYQILARISKEKESEVLSFIDEAINNRQHKNYTVFFEINPQSLS